jgi:transcriptional regulator PpsR
MIQSPVALSSLDVLSVQAREMAQAFITLASDIALVISDSGRVLHVAQGGSIALALEANLWQGRMWTDCVPTDSRAKVDQLLQEVNTTGTGRRREINHVSACGQALGVAYTAMRIGSGGPLLVVGRDLSAIMAIQQRFIDAQQKVERGAWQARQAEARYRQLFQVATDAVLVVDGQNFRIIEANQAASDLFELNLVSLTGRLVTFGFERTSRLMIEAMLTKARANGQSAEVLARLLGKVTATSLAVTPFGTDESMRLLVRIRALELPGTSASLSATLARLVDNARDGVVVTDETGIVLIANPEFLKLANMSTELAVKGRPLIDFIGLSGTQLSVLLSQVNSQGISSRHTTRLLCGDAQVMSVEISAALMSETDCQCIGFTIHRILHAG